MTVSAEERIRRLTRRQSVLDSVHQDFASLRDVLGGADWRKLDQHATLGPRVGAATGPAFGAELKAVGWMSQWTSGDP